MERSVEASKLQPIPGKRFLIKNDDVDEHQVIRMDSIRGGYTENGKTFVIFDREPSG